jgi:hypothetical protein
MSIRVSGVYLVPSPGQPSSPEKSDSPGGGSVVAVVKPTAVTIVTPQRSNSLDYLNFEEKRQIIASSLSLSDFLHHGPGAATKGVAATKVIVGKFELWTRSELSLRAASASEIIIIIIMKKQNHWFLVCKRSIPGVRPP